jgi:hypothetical protein
MERNEPYELKDRILFETFSVFRHFVLGKKKMPRTERSENALFERWKVEHAETIETLPWEAIIRIYADPPGITLLANTKRRNLIFAIVKTIAETEKKS